jgi:hypothetical protein
MIVIHACRQHVVPQFIDYILVVCLQLLALRCRLRVYVCLCEAGVYVYVRVTQRVVCFVCLEVRRNARLTVVVQAQTWRVQTCSVALVSCCACASISAEWTILSAVSLDRSVAASSITDFCVS